MVRIFAVDPGQRRVGVAISDEDGIIARPLKTLKVMGIPTAVRAVVAEVRAHDVGRIVIGLPLGLDGKESEASRRVRRFAAAVEAEVGLPIVLWDERLTTVAAERDLREAGIRGARRRQLVDQAAATILLQSYLDHSRYDRDGEGEG